MNSSRRFFSGDSLQQALVQAANHFQLEPEEVAYRVVDKRHGFVKVRRKVVIEVDGEAPRRESPPLKQPIPAAAPAPRPTPSSAAAVEGGARERPVRSAEARERGREERARGSRAPATGGGRGRPPRAREHPVAPPAASGPRAESSEREPVGLPAPVGRRGLVSLPERPRTKAELFTPAAGPRAEAAARGVELLLRISGLSLTARIFEGGERLEVDLAGPDADWCFADDGELLMAFEHLLPRIIRSLSGESLLCRVDCDNFHEIREERLRSLAQTVADEVRQRGRSRTLVPMNPADRRIIHVTLADDPAVVTESEGEGYFKRITVRPT